VTIKLSVTIYFIVAIKLSVAIFFLSFKFDIFAIYQTISCNVFYCDYQIISFNIFYCDYQTISCNIFYCDYHTISCNTFSCADSSKFHPATPQWNIITFSYKSYWFNIIASSDPNITTSLHKRCATYTDERKPHDITFKSMN
jgi:hypothetical protein